MRTTDRKLLVAVLTIALASCGGEGDAEKGTKTSAGEDQVEAATIATTMKAGTTLRRSDFETVAVNNGNVGSYAPITGRVVPRTTTQLVSEVQGRVRIGSRPFKEGTSFRKGQTIIRVDNTEFALNLEAQKSAFLNILTRMMPDLKADYPDNYQKWQHYVSSYKSGEPLAELPATTSDSEKYFVTSQQVYNTYYGIKAQETRLGKYTLTAPFNGSLSETLVDNGGLVSPGQPLGTFISNGSYEVETGVSLQLARKLKMGQKVSFTSKELGKDFEGTVVRINDILDTKTQNVPVFFKVNDPELRSGLYLEGSLQLDNYASAFNVPPGVIARDNTVHIVEDGTIRKKEVIVVASSRDSVTITGLENGTELIVTTFNKPISGLKITKQP
ncbi:MAG: HlyD family efflux transporter periplasmic adaptor subunit [Bacteroidota bacterium]